MNQMYQYQPLPQGDIIRLIKLPQGHSSWFRGTGRKMSCLLEHVSLADNPDYRALSYCWGGQEHTETIFCNGACLKITSNLFSALASLHSMKTERLLWADAICINQQDTDERSQQVRMMRNIFQGARSVYICLGEATDNSDKGFEFAKSLCSASRLQAYSSDRRNAISMDPRTLTSYFGVSNLHDESITAFVTISSRPWFRRIWVIQEVAVSSDVEIVCGSASIKWNEFVRAIEYAVEVGITAMHTNSNLERVLTMDLTRQEFRESARDSSLDGQGTDLQRLLCRHREYFSTNPRDMVYALIGLSNNSGPGRLNVEVDYRLDTREVYRKLAVAILTTNCNLDILGFCRVGKGKCTGTVRYLALPSWVPDWSTSEKAMTLMRQGLPQEQHVHFSAAKGFHYSPKFSADEHQLCLEGYFTDQISEMGRCPPRLEAIHQPLSKIKFFYLLYHGLVTRRNWEEVTSARSQNLQYVTGESMLDAYWQTLICGCLDPEGYVCTREMFYEMERTNSLYSQYYFLVRFFVPPFWLFLVAVYVLQILRELRKPIGISCYGLPKMTEIPLNLAKKAELSSSGEWTIVKTLRGYIGMVLVSAQPGDRIGLFKGGKVPLILRQVANGSPWQLVGEGYIHGIMHGEAFEEVKCENIWIQ